MKTNEGPSKDYGFPEGEEDLVDHEGQPLEDTLLRCFPEVGVFSMRDKEWGKYSTYILVDYIEDRCSISEGG